MKPFYPVLAGVFLALLAAVVALPGQVLAAAPETRAGEWVDGPLTFNFSQRARTPLGLAEESRSVYVSPVRRADFPFNALALNWKAAGGANPRFKIEVRAGKDGVHWSPWYSVLPDDDFKDQASAANDGTFSSLVAVAPSNCMQYRLKAIDGSRAEDWNIQALRWIYLNSLDDGHRGQAATKLTFTEEVTPTEEVTSTDDLDDSGTPTDEDPGAAPQVAEENALVASLPGVPIVTRKQWGANESFRYNAGKPIWPVERQVAEKVIIHHTVTGNFEANPTATVRSIYYYHAVTRGWGDIGYNYLIDWKGNIYEGRYGGKNVVAGHALEFNPGSIGIAIMGDYSATDITPESENALVTLLSVAASGIDPEGHSYFVDDDYPNIMGHRDVGSTACPGDLLYARIPEIRGEVLAKLGFVPNTSAQIIDVQFSPKTVIVGKPLRVDVVVKNTGNTTIGTQDPDPGYVYREGQSFKTQRFPKITGKLRVAIDFTDHKGVSHPYRWGLGTALEPGQTVTVTGYIQLNDPQVKEYWAGLVWEYVKYIEDGKGKSLVQAIPLPTRPADPIEGDPNVIYFPETQHNLGYEFLNYWRENGGLMQFGYPKTDGFAEVSPTDGKTYIVQYFERARFEYHPEFKGTQYEVLLGLLGNQLVDGRYFEPSPAFNSTPERTYFPETQHSLSYGFKYYWENNGGLPIYGFPISEEINEVNQADGRDYAVQYFERNRFEYHPEFAGTRYEVLLGLLGNEALKRMGWLE